jgi:predicted DCC family thiol-disulfide oxidoreductase YuxK
MRIQAHCTCSPYVESMSAAENVMCPAHGFELVMLYDGNCSVCTHSARMIQQRDSGHRIECANVQLGENAVRFPGFSPEAVQEQLHTVDVAGVTYIGVDGLREIGRRLPVWRLVAWLIGLPGVHWLAAAFYLRFARNRLFFNRFLGPPPPDCDNGSCRIH